VGLASLGHSGRCHPARRCVNFLPNAADACDFEDQPDWSIGVRVRLRGYLREGQLEVSHIFNAERLAAEDSL